MAEFVHIWPKDGLF